MQLNESTYETIFSLYIDNELSPKERSQVEAFIADNSSYALEMEALKSTLLSPVKIEYPFKENLKHQATETSLENLEEDWNQTYTALLKADLDAISGLSTSFKNALKKDITSEGIVIKPFGFSQQKFTYAAIAACLIVFLGYQQLTKAPVTNSITASTKIGVVPDVSKSSGMIVRMEPASKAIVKKSSILAKTEQQIITKQQVITKQQAIIKLQTSNSSKTQRVDLLLQEYIAKAETAPTNISINQAVIKERPRIYNNPITDNAASKTNGALESDTEIAKEEKEPISYEVIDTDDPNRAIYIANFEIDGTTFRGITRRVSALLKRNKSEKEK